MGYDTRYRLTLEPADPDVVSSASVPFDEDAIWGTVVDRDRTLVSVAGPDADGDQRWYEHETEMRALSARFSSVLFILDGAGEEAGDVWRKYFKDGRMQEWRPSLTPTPFDPEKLR